MKEYTNRKFTEERALFHTDGVKLSLCVFENGESPLKESRNITAEECLFRYKYPFWYDENVDIRKCTLFEMARAGIWYTKNVSLKETMVEAPKNLRRCDGVQLSDVTFADAKETLWWCRNIDMKNVTVRGDYFAMGCENVKGENLELIGNYGFDGVKNIEIRSSRLFTKDAFWNCENVTVYDSFISGEYLAWNSKNVTFVNCTIESLQGLCYVENLKLQNCTLMNTTLAFEYSDVEAELKGRVESVLNPGSGRISCDEIGELIYTPEGTDPGRTEILCPNILKRSDKVTW